MTERSNDEPTQRPLAIEVPADPLNPEGVPSGTEGTTVRSHRPVSAGHNERTPGAEATVTSGIVDPGVPMEQGGAYLRGPVMLRRGQVPATTTDARLLAHGQDSDWVHQDPWRVMRIQAEFVEGFGALAELGPGISVFGSARTRPGSADYEAAREVGRLLAENDLATITGGGPGIMEAANRGACEAGGLSVGLGIELPHEQGMNRWVDLGINFRYFFIRKTMFLKYSRGFIVLPGGFGTMDELWEAATMVQTHKVIAFPIVLVGRRYWQGLVDWVRETMIAEGTISPGDADLVTLVDTPAEAVDAVLAQIARLKDSSQLR